MRLSVVLPVFVAALAGPAAPAQPTTVPLTDAEKAFVAAHPVVRLMVDPHYQPADFVDANGVHRGMAADFLKLIADRTGLTFRPVPLPPEQWVELDPVKRGVDGVALSAKTPRRSEYYLTTDPLLEFPAYILTRQEKADRFLTPIDLRGWRVGVVSGYASEEHLRRNYRALTLVPYPTTDAGLRAVSFGEVDAFISTIPVSTFWLEKEGFSNLKIAGETGFIYSLGVTSRKDWPELHAILEKGVASITPEERDHVRRTWLNAPYEPFFRSRKFWSPVLWGFGVLLAVTVAALVWNRSLAARVQARTRELTESRALYRDTLENVSDVVLLARADGTFAYASAGVAGVFRRDPAEVAGGWTARRLLGDDLDAQVQAAGGRVKDVERLVIGSDGRPRTLLVTVTPVTIRDAVRLYVCHDVTDRVRLERQLRQKRTLESVGLLAGGVAHDFNNLLQVIGGFAELAGSDRTSAEARKGYLRRVAEATGKATGLTRQLLAVARRKPAEKTAVDVGRTTADLLPLLTGLVGRAVRIEWAPPPARLAVLADPTQVEQVLLNLLVNARDAMPTGGTATVGWDEVDVTAEQAAAHPGVTAGRFVRLRVSDTGDGIPPEVKSRIFEPFFTTKPDGMGTGLGLAVVLGVATDAAGFVEVQSEVGKGATFEVFWPRHGG